eukprot:TRINITY_DN59875_c0_g1_i1.p1 TRINITY_DN59875_c0_g1~~TRINITY_DN59875_c0_g1_i1.p1  ORF type:complete len:260 (+),score=46.39 TRINITY_DN59875_c0_g1_i1:431-1210(+)
MEMVEQRLRDAMRYGEGCGDEECCTDAMELLSRLLCQAGRRTEAHLLLADLGYTHTFAGSLVSMRVPPSAPGPSTGAKLHAMQQAGRFVNVFDDALPPDLLKLMRYGLRSNGPYWAENCYNSPRTGFFSFQHALPPWGAAADAQSSGLDQVLVHVWKVAAQEVPAVKNARYVEWWAHCRQHCYGHQLHFDSIPGQRQGDPRHPIISTVTFVTADCGGPTLVTDQTIQSGSSTKGWLAFPEPNRMVTFDGSLLHLSLIHI